jgi:hypothetical protein
MYKEAHPETVCEEPAKLSLPLPTYSTDHTPTQLADPKFYRRISQTHYTNLSPPFLSIFTFNQKFYKTPSLDSAVVFA